MCKPLLLCPFFLRPNLRNLAAQIMAEFCRAAVIQMSGVPEIGRRIDARLLQAGEHIKVEAPVPVRIGLHRLPIVVAVAVRSRKKHHLRPVRAACIKDLIQHFYRSGGYLILLELRVFRKRNGKAAGWGERVNAAGFGLLPGAAVWKIFEQFTALSKGTEVFEPLPAIPFLIPEGRFATSRIELILAAVCFAAVLMWLIARRKDLPGNGDLLWTVLCVWGLVRALTESFRAEPLLRAGNADLMQILFLVLADAGFAVWTERRIRTQKSAVFTAAEWIAVLTCETVMVLNTAGVLSIGSGIGDLVMLAGCTVLCTVLILLCGNDSRY